LGRPIRATTRQEVQMHVEQLPSVGEVVSNLEAQRDNIARSYPGGMSANRGF